MGLLITDKTADFSANPVGHAGLTTSVTSGLKALFETRRSTSKATNNSAPNMPNGWLTGTPPTFSATEAAVVSASGIALSTPASGGLTIMVVAKMVSTGSTATDYVAGSIAGTSTTQGCAAIAVGGRSAKLAVYTYTSNTPPLAGFASLNVSQSFLAGDDNTYQMLFGVLEDAVSARLYRPQTGTMVVQATPTGYFGFDKPAMFTTTPYATAPGAAESIAMFGHWSRPLLQAEMNTIYAEMKAQAAGYGLTIA